MMIKHYMRIYYPGSFVSETVDMQVSSRVVPAARPDGAYAVQFYDQTETNNGEEVLKGKPKNFSPTYYWGKEYSADDACKECGEGSILASNVRGTWQPLEGKDEVICV